MLEWPLLCFVKNKDRLEVALTMNTANGGMYDKQYNVGKVDMPNNIMLGRYAYMTNCNVGKRCLDARQLMCRPTKEDVQTTILKTDILRKKKN